MSISLNPNYLIQTGKPDLPRASAMNHIYDDSSLKFFPFDKIKDGDKLLFAACGNGVLMVKILKNIRANVSVTAIDSSVEQLACARALAESEGFLSIDWQQQTIDNLSELKGQFNLVHSRFVLNHLKDPKAAVRQLCNTLLPGGHFVSEDIGGLELSTVSEQPEHTETLQAWEAMVGLQHIKQKSNLAFGMKLSKTLAKLQMIVRSQDISSATASTIEQKEMFVSSLKGAPLVLPSLFLAVVPEMERRLIALRDDPTCHIAFKNFTQIQAEKI